MLLRHRFTTGLTLLLLGATLFGCSSPSNDEPGPAASPTLSSPFELPENPTLPGGEPLSTIALQGNGEYLRLKQSTAEIESLSGAELLERYPASSEPLGYDPAQAEFLDRIQASALGLSAGESKRCRARAS